MNERDQRVFLLFFSGHQQKEIALDVGTHLTNVSVILNLHGKEWVETCLRADYKTRILELSASLHNTQEIADIMGKPWNRYNVQFVLRKMKQSIVKKKALAKIIPQSSPITFRCTMCHRPYEQTMTEANLNPDRLCPTTPTHHGCLDRRVSERRGPNRVDITTQ